MDVKPLMFGYNKAQLIIRHIEEIKNFVEKQDQK
jgi:hypothetical protein